MDRIVRLFKAYYRVLRVTYQNHTLKRVVAGTGVIIWPHIHELATPTTGSRT